MRATNAQSSFVILLISATLLFGNSDGKNACNFPAIFNFGDSNSDTAASAGDSGSLREPYGQTWRAKDGERRRFSDGRLIIDFITEKLGLPYLSGHGDPKGSFSKGINFAVSGATLQRHDTGPTSYGPMFSSVAVTQKHQFQFIRNRTAPAPNSKSAEPQSLPMPEDFSKALYTIDIGQNDVNNLLVLKGIEATLVEIPKMIKDFSNFIQEIYQSGGRNFWIHNIGPLGCLSRTAQLEPRDEIGCSKPDNDAAQEFNKQLKDMLSNLRQKLKDASLIYVDVYSAKYSLFKDAAKFGFKNPLDYCCKGVSPYSSCGQYAYDNDGNYVLSPPCPNTKEYIIFDGMHYTEAANQIVANRIMDGSLSDPPVPITEACTQSSPQKTEL